ncbi:hypothetical protein J3Q64DRAFT_1849743 [Phycomyces blakesleeanus]|uniref:Uncharacterized protein n=1 Tax=Phycomyces blakesleeanus TaxID=4837 RepID=A0ABR3AXE0_PHYBL
MDRKHRQEQLEAASSTQQSSRVLGVISQDLVAPLPFDGQALLWLTPSLQVGTLFLLEAWLFTVGGLVYPLLVVKVHSTWSSKNILQSRARLFG